MEIEVRTDRKLIRAAASSTRYALVSLTAPEAPRRRDRAPVNVALVLDRSGSMGGQKIRLAREAAAQAIRMLGSQDRFALVVYDDTIDVIADSALATPGVKREALDRLAEVDARGSTALHEGWLRGCEQVAQRLAPDAVNRCLLLTDGLANRGITDADQLAEHAAGLRVRGVQTSTFGVGADFDEVLLQGMSEAGGGRFYFISAPENIPDIMTSELGEALEVTVRGAVLEVHMPHGVRAEPLHDFAFRRDGSVIRVELGDLVSSQQLQVVVKLTFPTGAPGDTVPVQFGIVDGTGARCTDPVMLEWTFASHAANDGQPRDPVVDREVARVYAGRASAEATRHNRARRYEEATRVLERTAARIRSYAGSDAVLNDLAAQLASKVERFSDAMPAPAMKEEHFAAYSLLKARSPEGKPMRR